MSMTVTRRRFPSALDFYTDVDRIFGNVLGGDHRASGYRPSWDIAETETAYDVTIELPGIAQSDIEIETVDQSLVVRGQKSVERETEGREFHQMERRTGNFERKLTFPKLVALENVEATLNNGVLHISVPKSEKALPNRIEIKSTQD